MVGPCADEINVRNFLGRLPEGYRWTPDPPITLDLVRKLPKADLHCTLVGSVSAEVVFECLKISNVSTADLIGRDLGTRDEFVQLWKGFDLYRKKSVTQSALRSPENLRMGVLDVLQKSNEDGVVYLEVSLFLFLSLSLSLSLFPSYSLSPPSLPLFFSLSLSLSNSLKLSWLFVRSHCPNMECPNGRSSPLSL